MSEAVQAVFGSIFKAHLRRVAIHAANRHRIERERKNMANGVPPAGARPEEPVTVEGDQLLERLKEAKR